MKEVVLTDSDYQTIKQLALNEWRDKQITYKNADSFNCMCYVSSFKAYCKSKGWTLIDGKLYVKEPDSK